MPREITPYTVIFYETSPHTLELPEAVVQEPPAEPLPLDAEEEPDNSARVRCPYQEWRDSLTPAFAARIDARITLLERGSRGDYEDIEEDFFELRFLGKGPGFRVYCGQVDKRIIIVLAGGDKDTQKKDIKKARSYWNDYKSRYG